MNRPNDLKEKVGKNSLRLIKLAVLCLALYFITMFVKGHFFKKPEKKESPLRSVTTALAVKQDVALYIESFGNFTSYRNVDIQSQVTGIIKEVHFKNGETVKKGQMLFTIDPAPFKAQLEKDEATLIEDLANLKLKQDTMERNRVLLQKELISKQDFEKFSTDVTSAEAKVKMDNAQIELSKINLGYCYIQSPIDGRAAKSHVDPGNIVTANQGPVLTNIKSVDPLYVDFTVPEKEIYRVREAMASEKVDVIAVPEGAKDKKYDAILQTFDNTVDNETGTIALRANVPNKNSELWPGQFVTIRVMLGVKKDAILVPYQAVQLGQAGDYAFAVTQDDKADYRKVKTGQREDENIIIEDGIKEGEKIVVTGQMGLAPGVTVKEIKPEEKTQKEE